AQGIEAGGVLELGRWTHIAVSISAGNEAKLYKNGVLMNTQSVWSPATVRRTSNYLGRSNWAADKYFDGQLAEIRIWGNVRSIDDLRTNLHRSLLGKEDGLQGYWPLDTLLPGSITKVRDHSTAGAHGSLINGATVVLTNALPVGVDAVVSAEYTTLGYDPQDPTKKQSMMRRFFGGRVLGAALLLPDKRVEAVDLKWVGNGQFAPTLLGYIEGAPPVPSENLTEGGDYKSATSVELSVSSDVEYSWSRSQSAAMGGNLDLFLGVDTQTMGGLGVMEQLLSVKVGAKGSVNYSKEQSSSTNITSSSSQTVADRLELRGTEESSPACPQLGTRFVPRNVGYALVISSLADVYVSRLKKSGRMVGYTILPVDGIPPDVNTITFLMNPAYVMQGSLDGMVGSRAASPRFYRDVPEMRTQYGSLYPASYYRIEEAYALKEKIEAADKERAAYFAQFSVSDPEAEVGVDLPTEKPSASAVATVLGKIKELGDEASQKLHASTAFLSWQKKMEDMLVRSGKRNIVNTYVWDADGGLHTDQQSFANTVEHTIGGSFNLDTSLGLEANVTAFGVAVDCTALMNSNLTQSISKTERSSTAVQLNVDLSGVESAGITDETERPLVPGEKVDRYRFMTFYLEGSTDNYNEFFQRVVDPEWLQMNSEEARALRQARGKANKTWRVLHRVTYVERPVLEGGVRGLPVAEKEDQVTKGIMDYFDELGLKNQMFETQLTRVQAQLELSRARSEALDAKLNQILALLTKA
ncbi:MAG TPA: LamG domain-containing protein, partial [Pseudomonadota bacterium]|nr:LamG domain-containing protein [Pseudomonadota bacterium]